MIRLSPWIRSEISRFTSRKRQANSARWNNPPIGIAAVAVVREVHLFLVVGGGPLVVELVRPGLDHDEGGVARGALAVVHALAVPLERGLADRWDVAKREQRLPLRGGRVHLRRHRSEAVRVDEVDVLPRPAPLRDARLAHLASRDHQDASLAVDDVAVDVDVVELVVRPEPLQREVAGAQDVGAPEPDVLRSSPRWPGRLPRSRRDRVPGRRSRSPRARTPASSPRCCPR